MKETYFEWKFPQPKWFWNFERTITYLGEIEEERTLLHKQLKELESRNKELKLILFDNPNNVQAKKEMEEISKADKLIESMLIDNSVTERTLNIVLGKLDHNEAFMKWRYNWDENGVCLGLRNLSEEKDDEN